ncbi:hypothetical protein A6S26_14690 [Nostoc sp. ATCC 43529]|nr:hypothetical protein A6S26_14690 [Nostoc sp. ATCC 43529]
MIDILGFTTTALKAVLPTVVKEIIKKAQSQLNPTELEKAIKTGIKAAQDADKNKQKGLLFACDDRQIDTFLAKVFEYSGVQTELENALKDKFPDIQNLIEAFKQVAQEQKIKLNEPDIEPWVRTFINIYFQELPVYGRYQAAKDNYLKQIIKDSEKIHFAGIKMKGQDWDIPEPLEKIFVIPDVINKEQKANRVSLNSKDMISANKLLNSSLPQQIVILGDPGSGKSTLMQYFAANVAQKKFAELGLPENLLPILIRIRDLANQPEINILTYLQERIPRKYSLDNIPEGFFDYWLKQGKAVILLDGLDEIADQNKQREVARHLSYFVTNNKYVQNRVIITSRPAEYKRDFFETPKFPHYFILPFDESKINLFIDRWYNTRFSDSEESQRRQSSLKELLNKQERIKILVENPLLLTLVCLIHRYDAVRLPQKRDKLYETAIETLLLNWEMIRFEEKQAPIYKKLEHIKFTNLQRLMEKLAYWIHCQQIAAEDKNSSTIVERDEIIQQLSKDIQHLKKIELYEAKQEAENFIDYISARSGLLNEQGKNCYAFVHKTFQEYLCAKEIDYRYQNGEGSYEEIVLHHIKEHLYNPHWREVLLLLIEIQKPKPIAKAIWAILEQDKENEQLYYHNLLFAGSCLTEDPNNLKTADNDPSLHILSELVKLEINPDLDEKIRSQVFSTFCNLSQTEFAKSALEVLAENQDRIDEARMQQYRNKLEKSKV